MAEVVGRQAAFGSRADRSPGPGPFPSFLLRDTESVPDFTVAPEAAFFTPGSPATTKRGWMDGYWKHQEARWRVGRPQLLGAFQSGQKESFFSRTFMFLSAHRSESPKLGDSDDWLQGM